MFEQKEFDERVVQVKRVTKVTTGGKRMAFRALSVIGDRKGRVGVGVGKALEVSAAIRKAVEAAKKSMITVPLIAGTIPHDIVGKVGASSMIMRPAPAGTGVIAGGAGRIVLELSGIHDIVAKCVGSSNAINVAFATIDGLKNLKTVDRETALRGKSLNVRYAQNAQA